MLCLAETGPWFLEAFPVREEESSGELPEMWRWSSVVLHVLAVSLMWEPAVLVMCVLREVQAGKAKRILCDFSWRVDLFNLI